MITNSTSASGRRSNKRGCFLRVVLGSGVLFLLLLAGGWGWLQSRPGKAWLANRLSAALDGVGGQSVHVVGLDGRVPFDVTAEEISLSDGEGMWLRVRELRLKWSLRDLLLHQRLDVREASARDVKIDRRPIWVSAPKSKEPASAMAFSIPPISVRTVVVNRVTLGEEVLGQAAEYAVRGRFESEPGLEQSTGDFSVLEYGLGKAHLSGTAGYRPGDGHAEFRATLLVDTNSATHHLIRAAPAGNLVAEVRGTGGADRWAGEVALDSSSWGTVRASFETGWRPAIRISATGDVRVVAKQIEGFPSEAAFTVHLDRQPGGPWVLQPGLRGTPEPWEASADLVLDPAAGTIQGSLGLSLPRLEPWLEPLGIAADGAVRVKADLSCAQLGSVGSGLKTGWDPAIRMKATGDVRVEAKQIEGFPSEAAFTVHLDRQPGGPWVLQPGLRGTPEPWEASANLALDPVARTIQGSLALSLPRLAPWLEPLGMAVEGKARLQADLAHTDGVHGLTLVGSAEDVEFDYGTVEAFRVHAGLSDVRDLGALTASVTATNARHEAILARGVAVRFTRRDTDWDLEASARGAWHREYALAGSAHMTLTTNLQTLQVEQLDVAYADQEGRVSAPFLLAHEAGRWDLEPVRLAVGDATLSLEGHYDNASVDLSAGLTNLSLQTLPIAMVEGLPASHLSARLAMTGHPASPEVRADAWISDVMPEEFRFEEWARAGVSVGASITGGTVSVEAGTTSLSSGDLDFEATMPLTFSLHPFAFEWSPDRAVDARLDADLDLASLNRFGFLKDQEVRGRVRAELVYEGPFRDVEADGTFVLEQGAYQHHRFGLMVQDIAADLRVREGALVLERLEGTDGEEGRLSATGRLSLDPAARWPFEAELRTEQTTVLRQDHLTAAASARLNVTGNVTEVTVLGDISVDSGEFRIDLLPPAPPPALNVTHVGRDVAALSAEPEDASDEEARGLAVLGKLELELAGPFFVRGAGIDSSWRGRLQLQSAGGPWRIRGTMQPRRGSYEFFGKRFTLVDSRVHFDGSSPPIPVLDVTAEYERQEILARLRISGRLDDPKLELESDPDLPPDEIMARVMFGTSASGLTPLQTAQLGLAVASMAREGGGGGSSWDLMGRTRNLLQVDELGLREDATDASNVELVAGRFVSDRLYLEFSQRIGSRESGLRAEYEINRHLSVETDAGAQMRPGIRLNVRVDY